MSIITHYSRFGKKQNGYRVFVAEVTVFSTPLAKVEVPQKWVLIMGDEGNITAVFF